MLLQEMKSVIKYVIELDIDYLETFLGYEGDKFLKITTKSQDTAHMIGSYAENLGLYCKTEYQTEGKYGPGYILFIGVEDHSVFKLQKDK